MNISTEINKLNTIFIKQDIIERAICFGDHLKALCQKMLDSQAIRMLNLRIVNVFRDHLII